jgi:hypothetical protein
MPFLSDLYMKGAFPATVCTAFVDVGLRERRIKQMRVCTGFAIDVNSRNFEHNVLRVLDLGDKSDFEVLKQEAKLLKFGALRSFKDAETFCEHMHAASVTICIDQDLGDPFGILITNMLPEQNTK